MITKVSKIGFLRANPNATYAEYKAATGGSRNSFYATRWTAVNYKPKDKTKAKRKYTRKPVAEPTVSKEHLRISSLEAEVQELRDQIVAYKAVISYLEHGVSHMRHEAKNYSGFDNFRGFE